MSSNELVHISAEEIFNEQIRPVCDSIELELIFNRHGDEADATLSASHIEPNSIVFLEGIKGETQPMADGKVTISDGVANLSYMLLELGPSSPEYTDAKAGALMAINQHIATVRAKEGSLWDLTMYKRLVEKDCAVFVADVDSSREAFSESSFLNGLEEGRRSIGFTALSLDEGLSIGKTRNRAIDIYHSYMRMQYVREAICVVELSTQMNSIINTLGVDDTNAAHTEDGKLKVYTVWGTAHAHSLAAAFKKRQYETMSHIIGERPDIRYINPNIAEAMERTSEVILADIISDSIRLTFLNKPEGGAGQLMESLAANPPEKKAMPFYIRAFQLNRELQKLGTMLDTVQTDEEISQLDQAYNAATHNLRNLLTELGIEADEYVVNPFAEVAP